LEVTLATGVNQGCENMMRKKEKENARQPVDLKSGIALLQKQIEEGRRLLDSGPVKSSDHTAWNNRTRDCLIRIYGKGSPNVDTIVQASGGAPVWLFMPGDAAERYEASCIENKIRLLEGCVVTLKRKDREFEAA
jgi:hypothetical protein